MARRRQVAAKKRLLSIGSRLAHARAVSEHLWPRPEATGATDERGEKETSVIDILAFCAWLPLKWWQSLLFARSALITAWKILSQRARGAQRASASSARVAQKPRSALTATAAAGL